MKTLRKKNPSAPTANQMFLDRMLRENRWQEWEAARAADYTAVIGPKPPEGVPLAEKINYGRLRTIEAKKRCGWLSDQHERATHRAYVGHTARESELKAGGRVASARTFDEALKLLPVKADPQVENDWVMAHPAIARKSRMEDQSQRVIINGTDLLEADHGPCPSRAAANKLQYWSNKPEKAFEALTMPMKRPDGGDSRDGEVVEDMELAEVQRLLKEVRGV